MVCGLSTSKQPLNSREDALDTIAGTGIGLAMVKKLTDLLGGNIKVISQLGQGSVFIMDLPINKIEHGDILIGNTNQENGSFDEVEEEVVGVQEHDKILQHVLIVEDHEDIQSFIQMILEPYYQVSLASNGKEGLEVLSSNLSRKQGSPISLIISDVMMPELDGIEFVRQIKRNEIWKKIPFIFLTGYSNEKTQSKAMRLGVDDYLIKPFEPEELLAQVKNLLIRKANRTTEDDPSISENTSSNDPNWMAALNQLIHENIENFDLDINFLAHEMAIGKRQFARKVKMNTGLSPGKYIQEVRLQHARKLLEQKTHYSVSNVCYAVGYKRPKYFSQQFKLRFGRLPSSYYE